MFPKMCYSIIICILLNLGLSISFKLNSLKFYNACPNALTLQTKRVGTSSPHQHISNIYSAQNKCINSQSNLNIRSECANNMTYNKNINIMSNRSLNEESQIVPLELIDEVKSSFMSYSLSTILGRALPDVRDGLKPVHRRVLYSMFTLNLLPATSYRKSARIVGEVLGKFHPHGDQSVYDALVRMVQNFVMPHPLVLGHGNFGSIDDDPPAAMRYTESKLSSFAFDCLFADIKYDSVGFVSNFDGSEIEPKVLPSRLPLVLLNGASGIAVGMATNIPPHNLNEVVSAIAAMVDNPNITNHELCQIILGPDFPTGGKIVGTSGVKNIYDTGSGSIIIRASSHIERNSYNGKLKNSIVITEIPYLINKSSLVASIAKLVNDKTLEGVSDIRDESDRDGIRIVIELKKDFQPNFVLNNLYKKTSLQTVFSGNILAIVDNGLHPKRLSLKEILNEFISFRFSIIRNRTNNQLHKLNKRRHVLLGLQEATRNIDQIIEIIKNSNNITEVKQRLSDTYKFSSDQSDAILAMKLGRLSSFEIQSLEHENDNLVKEIESLNSLMGNDKEVNDLIKLEAMEIAKKHGVPRKTELLKDDTAVLKEEDIILNERSIVILTEKGYIKRISNSEFESQARGGKGKLGMRLNNDTDSVLQIFTCNSHDSVLFFTARGVALKLRAFKIPLLSRSAKGVPLSQLLPLSTSEKITAAIPVVKFTDYEYVVLLTAHGYIKRIPLKTFENITSRGLSVTSLREADSLSWVRQCLSTDETIIATRCGLATRIKVEELTLTGRLSRGVKALKLNKYDYIADLDIVTNNNLNRENPCFLVVTRKGYGKRVLVRDFRVKHRRGAGVIAIRFKAKAGGSPKLTSTTNHTSVSPDFLQCMRVCNPDDCITLSTKKGNVIRQYSKDIPIQSRTGSGAKIQILTNDDRVVMVDINNNDEN